MRTSRRNSAPVGAGFTLAEILVVVGVVAVIAALAVPYFGSMDGTQAVSAARTLASDLEYAQNVAITVQEPVTVTFSDSGETYTLSNASGPLIHPITKAAYTEDFRARDGLSDVDLVSASFGGASSVTFDSLGTPDSAGTVTLQAGPHVYRVNVASVTGRVSVTADGS